LGRARLLQIRVKENSCEVASSFKKLISECTATFELRKQEDQPFGKALSGINSTDITYDALVKIST